MKVATTGGFRPFRAEMAAVAAGWHDGIRTTLDAVHAGNELVVEHEFIHNRIFHETADGQVLSLVLRLLDTAKIGEADRTQAETLADVLAASSRTAHEAAATYLSLQLLSNGPDETPALLAPLPQDYQAYQAAFADRFDPIFGSTFLRYLAAWCATSLAFWSPLIEQFATERLALAARLQDGIPEHLSPDLRLQRVVAAVAAGFDGTMRGRLQARADALCRSRGVATFDLHDDAGWDASGIARELDAILMIEVLEPWMEQISGLDLLGVERHQAALERLTPWFKTAVGLELELRSSRDGEVFSEQRALADGATRLYHAPRPPDESVAKLLQNAVPLTADRLGDVGTLWAVEQDQPAPATWYLFGRWRLGAAASGEFDFAAVVSAETLVQWVSPEGPLMHREGPPVILEVALARVSSFPDLAARVFGPNRLADLTPDIGALLALEEASREPSFPAACFVHLDGDLTKWLNHLGKTKVKYSVWPSITHDKTGTRQLCIFLFSLGLPIFFKLFPITLADAALRIINPLLVDGRLAEATDQEAASVRENIGVLYVMISFWRLV